MKNNCIYKKYFKESFTVKQQPFIGDDNKYHYLYRIEFPNGNYYLGEHTTKIINDGYAGSGVMLPREYGRCNITEVKKIILSFYKTKSEMEEEEKKLIGDLYKTDKKCLNLIPGGSSGFNEKIINEMIKSRVGRKRTKESIEKQRKTCTGKHHSDETRKKQSEWHKNFWSTEGCEEKRKSISEAMRNRIITNEIRKKISDGKIRYYNSQYGRNFTRYTHYVKEVSLSPDKDKIIDMLEKARYNLLSDDEMSFLTNFWDECKYNRKRNKKEKTKYVFTEEHRNNLSKSKIGKKLTDSTKAKMSEKRKGRMNSRYRDDIIYMCDGNFVNIREFKDAIEARDYIVSTSNSKATTSEIFVACRTGKTRYGYKWKNKERNI